VGAILLHIRSSLAAGCESNARRPSESSDGAKKRSDTTQWPCECPHVDFLLAVTPYKNKRDQEPAVVDETVPESIGDFVRHVLAVPGVSKPRQMPVDRPLPMLRQDRDLKRWTRDMTT